MKWVEHSSDRVPIKSWCVNVDEGAKQQAVNLAEHPRIFKHVALMPDCHQGYGMPIGGVIACDNALIPNAVGVDIGCGMAAVQTTASEISTEAVQDILDKAKSLIPVGFNRHDRDQAWDGFDIAPDVPVIQQQLSAARKQIGTLGGGNHFIELQMGDDSHVWLMLHSGSRNFGYRVAKEYNKRAQALCEMWHSDIPKYTGEDGLAFLPIGTPDAREYILAMNYALKFAHANRAAMMTVLKEVVAARLGCSFNAEVNIHHNFAAQETHFGQNVWVHRKGATRARVNEAGIIPGSMGTASYIVEGLGNRDSFGSCSHGAGRNVGRAEFSRTHSQEECDASMEGIVFGGWSKDRKGRLDLSEAPGAYKDIDEVIEAQTDLVKVLVKLRPLGVMKG